MIILFGASTWAGGSRLVINLADHVRNQAGQDDPLPAWAPPGSRPKIHIGEIAKGRAANGISTRRTTDPPERGNCRRPPPSGNSTSTEGLPSAATIETV